MIDNKTLWDGVLAEIELNLSKANFGTWFRNTHVCKQEEGVVFVSVPNTFVRDWLSNKYHKMILQTLRDVLPEIRSVEYVIYKSSDLAKVQNQGLVAPKPAPSDLGLQDLYINKESNLNPKYTLDTFIIGSFNELAYAAASAVIKNPGTNYNPLFIYGSTGVGKTHLIQAVGNQIKKNYPTKRVYYINSETFVLDFMNSMQTNKGNQFKEKYRKYDFLVIDDIQFLSGKDKSQEELFHLFNNFHDNNKQIIFSSDRPPKQIDKIEDRLRSRFEGGMMVDISKPDFESRLCILKQKGIQLNVTLSDEILDFLADTIQDNIRELEGALNVIQCQMEAKGRSLSISEIKNIIKNSIKPKKVISIPEVIRIVAEFYNIEERFMKEKTRRKEVVKPRQIAMFILREDINTSYPYIGESLGGRDHTTVIHAYEKIKNDLKNNSNLKTEIDQIRTLIYKN